MVKPGDRRNAVAYLKQAYHVSITRACKVARLPKSMFYYQTVKDDTKVIDKLNALVEHKPTRGFPYYFRRIRNEGLAWNHKRVKRVYNKLELNLRRKHKRRLPARLVQVLGLPENINQTWSMDFMHDCLMSGRKVRIFNLIDDFNREALAIDVNYSHSGHSVMQALERIFQERGKPKEIRCDNGPEFISNALSNYCKDQGVLLKYIQPGKPTQNAFIERFNRSFREDVLDAYLFESIEDVRNIAWKWMEDYNENHPHQSLKNLSPNNYLKQFNHI